jgi:hypothetical protein
MSDETTFDDVKIYVLTQASAQELDTLIDYYKARRKNLGVAAGFSFKPGDPVKFNARSKGIITGKFVKQMNKNAEVVADNGVTWRVNPLLLQKA